MGERIIWLKGVKFCLFCKMILDSSMASLGAGTEHLLESFHKGGWTPSSHPQFGLEIKMVDATNIKNAWKGLSLA